MAETKLRMGRFDKAECAYVQKHLKDMEINDIAANLNRDPNSIRSWARNNGLSITDGGEPEVEKIMMKLIKKLKASVEWQALKEEFVDTELDYFAYRFAKLMNQFGEDILATEETQVVQLIKFEILMQRNLKGSKTGVFAIKRLEKLLNDTYDKHRGKEDEMEINERTLLMNLENQVGSMKAAQQAKSTEFIKLQEKFSAIQKELKATRDQRFSKAETSKETYIQLLKQLQQEDSRRHEGRQLGLVKLATTKEAERLGSYHKYSDDSFDKPILSHETVQDNE